MSDPYENQKTLELLAAVESGSQSTQRGLSSNLGVALGMTNALIKRCVHKGYLKVKEAPARRFAYYLTPQGFTEKSRLVADYVTSSLEFFRLVRSQYDDLMLRANEQGVGRIVLVGCNELAEIAFLSASNAGLTIAGVLDLGKTRTSYFHNHPVVESVSDIDFDVAIIAEAKDPQGVYDTLCRQIPPDKVAFPRLLMITPSGGGR